MNEFTKKLKKQLLELQEDLDKRPNVVMGFDHTNKWVEFSEKEFIQYLK